VEEVKSLERRMREVLLRRHPEWNLLLQILRLLGTARGYEERWE